MSGMDSVLLQNILQDLRDGKNFGLIVKLRNLDKLDIGIARLRRDIINEVGIDKFREAIAEGREKPQYTLNILNQLFLNVKRDGNLTKSDLGDLIEFLQDTVVELAALQDQTGD